jgi:hypothetical protein
MELVTGLFENPQQAHEAIEALKQAGFEMKRNMGVMVREGILEEHMEWDRTPAATHGAVAGGAGGSALGGLVGLLAGLGALTIPGLGPVLAVGTLVAALESAAVGAAAGAGAGSVIGALMGLGLPEDEAHLYAEGVKRGGVLVTVEAEEEHAEKALAVMQKMGALNVEEQSREWTQKGWVEFQPDQMPNEDYPTL